MLLMNLIEEENLNGVSMRIDIDFVRFLFIVCTEFEKVSSIIGETAE